MKAALSKTTLTAIIAVALAFTLSACDSSGGTSSNNNDPSDTPTDNVVWVWYHCSYTETIGYSIIQSCDAKQYNQNSVYVSTPTCQGITGKNVDGKVSQGPCPLPSSSSTRNVTTPSSSSNATVTGVTGSCEWNETGWASGARVCVENKSKSYCTDRSGTFKEEGICNTSEFDWCYNPNSSSCGVLNKTSCFNNNRFLANEELCESL